MTRARILTDQGSISEVVRSARRVVVLGIKPETRRDQPAYYVPAYLAERGVSIVPAPIYYPNVTEILGEPVVRALGEITGEVDILDVFRRSEDLEDHLDDILALHPTTVWLQSGIRDDAFAERLAEAGIQVVQDRCLMVEHRRVNARL